MQFCNFCASYLNANDYARGILLTVFENDIFDEVSPVCSSCFDWVVDWYRLHRSQVRGTV
jgi:hypothetical protein